MKTKLDKKPYKEIEKIIKKFNNKDVNFFINYPEYKTRKSLRYCVGTGKLKHKLMDELEILKKKLLLL